MIKAIIIDIDGCLSPVEFGKPLDLDSLQQIQDISWQYHGDPCIPLLVLNTGRDVNHTELMAKILDAFHYFIIEMGAAIASIHGAELQYHLHEALTPEVLAQFDQLQEAFLDAFPLYRSYLQHGKRYMISFLFELGNQDKDDCAADISSFINDHEFPFRVDVGHNFINIVHPSINKGSGLDLLLEIDGELSTENIAGIGDSTGDWDFLERCAFSACPANASEVLKQRCEFVASKQEAQGVLEILRYIMARNRHLQDLDRRTQKKPEVMIKSVISDINGTIDSAVYGRALDFNGIKRIRDIIERSAGDPAIPALYLNTGWDQSYTILYAQLLNNISKPHVIERGAAIVSIDGSFVHVTVDPKLTPDVISRIARLQSGFMAKFPHYYRYLQVGKVFMMSFQFEVGSIDKEECLSDLKEFMAKNDLSADFEIDDGPNYINVGVPGIDKGTGAELLVNVVGASFESIAGIGDSDGDWSFISKCGYKACPSNASRFLKEHCDYVASKPETEGFLEILEQIIQWNLEKMLGSGT
jgi:hydroxymethylpyrimidine pyrophosphatase-like HAD family hydrolase